MQDEKLRNIQDNLVVYKLASYIVASTSGLGLIFAGLYPSERFFGVIAANTTTDRVAFVAFGVPILLSSITTIWSAFRPLSDYSPESDEPLEEPKAKAAQNAIDSRKAGIERDVASHFSKNRSIQHDSLPPSKRET